MSSHPQATDEAVRLDVLRQYGVLDTPPEKALDDLAALAAMVCAAPMAVVSLVDATRQWFKARVGIEVPETSRQISFCAHALRQRDLLIVPDALKDERFAENPLVTGDLHLRFYAGAPLVTPEGAVLGTLSVLDHVPRELSPEQAQALRVLRTEVMAHLELRRGRRDLQASEADRANILASALDGIIVVNAEGRICEFNPAAEQIFRYSRAEVLGRTLEETIVPAELRGRHREGLSRYLQTGAARLLGRRIEITALRADGVTFPVELSIVRSPGAEPPHFIGFLRDITERKLAEEALHASEARLIAAQEVAKVGSWELNLSDLTVLWSAEAYRIWEKVPGEFHPTFHSLLEFVHPDDRAAAEHTFTESLSGRAPCNLEHRLLFPAGRIKHIEQRWQIIRDADGKPLRALGTGQDITERRQLEQQFLRAQRMESIGTLAGGIAHDLNNVLAPIVMSLDLLKLRCADPESLELIEILALSAERGAGMVKQVLSFARGMEGLRLAVQMPQLVGDIATIIRETFPKGIQIHTAVSDEMWTVMGDPTQLHQVLLNLCVNARDAMPDGGTLTIAAENVTLDAHYCALDLEAKPGPYLCLQVEDNGTGIAPAISDKIFDPFFTTKEVGKGTGLGLSTSLAIVKSHGGFLRVYSEMGKGTRFKVYLPAQTARPPASATKSAAEMPRGNSELVLVVDDEAPVRQITRQTLEAFGYRVALAADGAEALAIYADRRHEIAVVLTDMTMPVMDGPATIRGLRTMNPRVRIIAASGLAANDHVTQVASLGVKHFLPKPYTAETMLKVLMELLGED